MPSLSPTPEQIQNLGNHIQDQGKIAQLIQLRALGWLNQSEKRQAQTDQAERDWYEKQLGGARAEAADDEMETTILGDIHLNQPQSPAAPLNATPQQQSQLAPLLAGFAIAAASGLGGYYLASKDDTTPVQPSAPIEFNDETISVGLGKIEDYLKVNE